MGNRHSAQLCNPISTFLTVGTVYMVQKVDDKTVKKLRATVNPIQRGPCPVRSM